ncbi:unnamed protein product [Caenorhabditis bovis]|uniref:Uncharacterized protein n=1 Tax=Caenorhabditis bovis TaxID=2654633 RepID=A0A8S1FD21_9PELO|nr:unnamed protein product [Caenorhabditis bovis]
MFSRRCNTDAEFRLIQCCSTCNTNGTGMAYDLIARSLVSEHCFDRYGSQFCGRYVNKTDVFEPHNTWSCSGMNPQIAFRSCRLSCGYCNFSVVHYTIDNAIKACNKNKNPIGSYRWQKLHRSTPKPSSTPATPSPVPLLPEYESLDTLY